MEPAPRDLILPWSERLAEGEAPLPFVAKYNRDDKTIYYLAATHGNKIQDDTFKLFLKVSKEFPADIFLLEGFESAKGESPQEVKQWALADGANGLFKGGEPAFATQVALQKKVPFKGLEPTEIEIYKALLKEKFTAPDMIHYYFLKQVSRWRKAGTLDAANIARNYKNFVQGISKKIEVSDAPTYAELLNWYKLKNKEDLDIRSVDLEKLAPLGDGVHFTQKLSFAVSRIRDRHMVQVIESELKVRKHILVLAGGTHWMTQKLALEAIAGYPSFEYKQY
ncbi:MAG: hypothetical protein IT287_01020 [Bdellovibrionaceae bacterium]|nr:hypothetical protein [Pseudobdellovibrionaceae bacterium]